MEKKLHWFSLVFLFDNTYVSTYRGHRWKRITKNHIVDAKKRAGAPEDALLLSVSYLGRMTIEKFNPEHGGEVI